MTEDEVAARFQRWLTEATANRPQLFELSASRNRATCPRLIPWPPHGWALVFDYDFPPSKTFDALIVPSNDLMPAQEVTGHIGGSYFWHQGELGLPRSSLRRIGSALGYYQLFQYGVAVWDTPPPQPYLNSYSPRPDLERCDAAVAFMDLRGFTGWAAQQLSPGSRNEQDDLKKIEDPMVNLEGLLQDVFWLGTWNSVFFKGLGDGFMVVAELNQFRGQLQTLNKDPAPHIEAFLKACTCFVHKANQHIAAKLQRLATNEVIIGPTAVGILQGRVWNLTEENLHMKDPIPLRLRGARLPVENCVPPPSFDKNGSPIGG